MSRRAARFPGALILSAVAFLTLSSLLFAQDAAPPAAGSRSAVQSAPAAPAASAPAGPLAGEPAFPVVVYEKSAPPQTPRVQDLPLTQSVTRHGITWTFEKPVRAGRFVTGDWYVVGPAVVVAISPRPLSGKEVEGSGPWTAVEVKDANGRTVRQYVDITDAERKDLPGGQFQRNGSVLNPEAKRNVTGYDSRVAHHRYKPELTARLPIALRPGDALMSSISKQRVGGDYVVQSYSILTCLKEPAPPDAFRPAPCDREQVMYLARHLRRELLPRLALPPAPTPEETKDLRIRTYPPRIKDSEDDFARPWNETNFFEGDQTDYQGGGYGRSVAERVGRASLLLMLDFPMAEKERLLENLVQYGIDLWGLVRGGIEGWTAHGGWGSGRKWAITFAGIMLGEEKMAHVNRSYPNTAFQEDLQTRHDDCWTGAGVVYYGHVGARALKEERTPPGWGPYEHLHPSRWVQWIGESYRGNMTSNTWIAEALAIRLLQAEKQWNGDAFLDYCDRWMTEPDPGYNNGYDFSVQGFGWDPFFRQMWKAYREDLPAVEGKKVDRPPTGWRKQRTLKGPAVEIGPNREFRVGGKPMLPILLFAVGPSRIDDALAIGANAIAEGSLEPHVLPYYLVNNREFLDQLAAKGLFGVFGADARTIGHPALLGWTHLDAPDRILEVPPAARRKNAILPEWASASWAIQNDPLQKGRDEALVLVEPAYRWMRQMDKTRPVFLTLGAGLLKGEGNVPADVKAKLYPEYVKSADAVGCAVFPVSRDGSPARLTDVASAVEELVKLAPGKPVYAWIETRLPEPSAARSRSSSQRLPAGAAAPASPLTPELVRAEVWMAILRGATGIGYRGFEDPSPDVRPGAAMLAELKRINAKLASLAPAILSAPAKASCRVTMSNGGACHFMTRELDGAVYVFAQGLDAKSGTASRATIEVQGLKAGSKVEVVGEGRSITASAGRFEDDFAPLAEHVYRLTVP